MSQSLPYHAFDVREGYDYVRTEYQQRPVEFPLTVTDRLLVMSAEDNLAKGASGQAVQAFNILCGFSETAGLL